MDVFKIVDNSIEFNKAEYAAIPQFAKLLAKQGRNKKYAIGMFHVMYSVHHPTSFLVQSGDSLEDRYVRAVKECDVPDSWEPEGDLTYKDAEAEYIRINNCDITAVRVYKEIVRSVSSTDRTVRLLTDTINTLLDNLESGDVSELTNSITDILTLQKRVGEIADSIPARIIKLKEAEKLAFKDMADKEVAKGDKAVDDSMLTVNAPKHRSL